MKKEIIILTFFFLIGFLLRFYLLGQIPSGLTNDEADIGYDAYSILKTGRDQWGAILPTTNFKGFGDYRPVLYTYLVIPFIKLFDLTPLAVRLPSAIFGAFSIIMIYYVAKKLFGLYPALFSAFIFSISPWSIGLSRIGIESNVAIFLVLISIFFLLKFKEKISNLYIGLFFLVLTIYTYSAYSLLAFFIFGIFLVFNRNILFNKKLIPVVFFIILLLLPVLFKNLTAATRFSQIGFTNNINSIGLLDVLNAKRGACLKDYPLIICKIFDNKISLFSGELIKNYFSHFSPNFLFFEGTDTQYSILYKRGLEYSLEIIVFILGIYSIFKSKRREGIFLLGLFLISVIPDSLTGSGHYSRSSSMLPFLIIIEGLGFYYLLKRIRVLKNTALKILIIFIVSIVVLFGIASFQITYATYFRDNYSRSSLYGYEELMRKVNKEKNNYDMIFISKNLNDTKQYIYYLFFNRSDPEKFQKKNNVRYVEDKDGWVEVRQIDNIYFVGNLSEIKYKSLLGKKVLFFAHPSEFPDKTKILGEIKDRTGTVEFSEVNLRDLKFTDENQMF